jgi:Fe-S-cluster-containing hydrogenase component 2
MKNYEKLRQILNKHPVGAPKSKAFDEILRTLFTPDEVEAALGMGFAPRSIGRIASITNLSEGEVHKRCESMANKGIVFSREKGGEMGYALLPTIPGIFEFPFMTGGGTPMHDRLGKLWEKYHHEAMGNEFAGSKTPLTRVIPIEKTVSPNVEVMPYEELSKMLNLAKTFSMAKCACRVSLGACDHPHDVCLIFDKTAEFLMERGFAQKISRDQAEEILYRAEEVGLVHTTNNSQDRLNFVCNCCPCCCTILRGATQLQNPNAFLKSRWYAKVEPDQCVGCGVCEDERCPVDAVKVVEDIARVNSEQCIGCGLCATTCEEDSIKMSFRGLEDQEPPATVSEMGLKVAVEKGKMDDFLKLMER